jgi:hypothetical protein
MSVSWFQKAESWFAKFFTNTNWAHSASVGLALAGPPAILIVQDTLGSADAAEGQAVLNEVQTDLGTVSQLLAEAQGDAKNPTRNTKIVAVLNSFKNNLSKILTMSHVKDAKNVAEITNIVNAAISEADAVISMIPDSTPPPPPPPPPAA